MTYLTLQRKGFHLVSTIQLEQCKSKTSAHEFIQTQFVENKNMHKFPLGSNQNDKIQTKKSQVRST